MYSDERAGWLGLCERSREDEDEADGDCWDVPRAAFDLAEPAGFRKLDRNMAHGW